METMGFWSWMIVSFIVGCVVAIAGAVTYCQAKEMARNAEKRKIDNGFKKRNA